MFIGPIQMYRRLISDTCLFSNNLFLKVKEDSAENGLKYLNLEYFEMVESVLDKFGGLYNTKPVYLSLIIKELQTRLELFPLLKK
jgi:hypothetical protein